MKTLLFLGLLLVFSFNVNAQESCSSQCESQDVNTPTPKELKDAVIVVKTKDGKEYKMSANQMKVVPRKQQFKVKERVVTKTVVKKAEKKEKNILSLTVNRSRDKYKLTNVPNGYKIEEVYDYALGAMYQRRVMDDLIIGVQGDLNKSFGVNVGLEF